MTGPVAFRKAHSSHDRFIPHMIVRGLAGESLLVYGDGGNICDYLYVAEHAMR
nr:NAD-dependent epimerase/dehydratase family protein [Bradyrhizobium manausense]